MKFGSLDFKGFHVGSEDVKSIAIGAEQVWSSNRYIEFEDSMVGSICAEEWGDGVGITYEQAAAVTSLGTVFAGMGPVAAFNELEYFTGLQSVSSEAFVATSLRTIRIPYSVKTIENKAFYSCDSLTDITISEGSRLTSIGSEAFSGCSSLKSITLPDGVTSIGNSAFESCSSLKTIDIPEGVTSIGNGAFRNCSSLIFIFLPDSATNVGEQAFFNCTSMGTVRAGSMGVTKVGRQAFHNTKWYNDLSDGLVYIESSSTSKRILYGYKGTMPVNTTINVSEPVIADYAFEDCAGLVTIKLSWLLQIIGVGAFKGCQNLSTVNGDDAIYKTIGASAFSGCSSLTSFGISKYVTSIGNNAFAGCSNLVSFAIAEGSGLTEIATGTFTNCSRLASIDIWEGVTSIGTGAFEGCTSLTKADIRNPENSSMRNIGGYAFYGCSSLGRITIPPNVTSIGSSAFEGCSELRTVVNYSALNIQKGSSSNGYVGYYAHEIIIA